MKLRHFILPALLVDSILLLGSCKKKHTDDPQPALQHFEVDFNNGVIDIAKVDSVTISFNQLSGVATTKKMQGSGGAYRVDRQDNDPVNAQVIVYTPKDDSVVGPKPIRSFVYEVANTNGFVINGPTDKTGDTWKHRYIFKDDTNHISLTVGEDQADPYFLIKVARPQDWIDAYLQKAIYTANAQYLDNDTWQTFSSDSIFPEGSNTFLNTTSFVPYSNRVANASWEQATVFLQMLNKDNIHDVIIFSAYNRRR